MRKALLLAVFGLLIGACGGEATATTVAESTTTTQATTTTQPTTTTTSVDVGLDLLENLRADDFEASADLDGSLTAGAFVFDLAGLVEGNEDTDRSVLTLILDGDVIESTESIEVDGFAYDREIDGPWIRTEVVEDGEPDLSDYLDGLDTLVSDGTVDVDGVTYLRFVPSESPDPAALGLDALGDDAEVAAVFLSDEDGEPYAMNFVFAGDFDGVDAEMVFNLTFTDSPVSIEAPSEYRIGYESEQELPYSVAYPRDWEGGPEGDDGSGRPQFDAFSGPDFQTVEITSYLLGRELITLEEWAELALADVRSDSTVTIIDELYFVLGPDDLDWLVVDLLADDPEFPVYGIYAGAVIPGEGAFDVFWFSDAGFEDLDYNDFIDFLSTVEIVEE